ncbi:MAG: ABC transporter permease [Actinomycetota bacterium]
MRALISSELRQRIRGKRWWILLGIWFFIIFGFTSLIRNGAKSAYRFDPEFADPIGNVMFGSLVLFVLGLMSLIIPSLTSTSINGERDRGTLAVLQSTMMRPGQIFLAKFVSALIVAAAFLAATVPLTLWAATEGGISFGRTVIVYVLLLVSSALLVVIGLAASSLVRKPSLSAVAAYSVVFLLTIGTPILFGLSLATAEERGFERMVGWRWAILAPNPFVVVADAAPRAGEDRFFSNDPLAGIRDSVRQARKPPRPRGAEGVIEFDPENPQEEFEFGGGAALWPTGMAIQAALAAIGVYIVIRKLKVPARRLGTGERIA